MHAWTLEGAFEVFQVLLKAGDVFLPKLSVEPDASEYDLSLIFTNRGGYFSRLNGLRVHEQFVKQWRPAQ